MITYKSRVVKYGLGIREIVSVILDGKRVGVIRKEQGGWRYWPKDTDRGGELYPSLAAAKKSLES